MKNLQIILKKIRKEQHTKRRLAKNAAKNVMEIVQPFKAAYQACKSSTLKPADIMRWSEFQKVLPIATVRAPELFQLITI